MAAETHAVLVIGGAEEVRAAEIAAAALGLTLGRATSLAEGLGLRATRRWSATLLSLELGGADLVLAERVVREPGTGALVLLARQPTLELAMAATRLGAAELLPLPLDTERLASVLRPLLAAAGGVPLPDVSGAGEEVLVGESPALLELFKAVGRVAGSAATVLVTGESGTGKELVARAVHRLSPRAAGPFVAVNCAAIPEDLLESELFGHERGAFTGAVARKVGRFERAHGGTLFLDEIGDMSLVLQAKILRALQEREIERVGGEGRVALDVRVVAATHRDLPALIAAGDFREDLYYRLAVVRLHLPPLRERPGDVRALVLHYATRFAATHARPLSAISTEALDLLAAHPWPGNVRELRNVLERAVLVSRGGTLLPEHLELERGRALAATPATAELLPGYATSLSMAQVEALHLARVLAEVGGHFGHAAERLGMHRNTVSRKAQEYGLVEVAG